MDNQIVAKWNEFKAIVTDLELDLLKNAKGNNAAGVRVRKGLRVLKAKASEIVKITVNIDKVRKSLK